MLYMRLGAKPKKRGGKFWIFRHNKEHEVPFTQGEQDALYKALAQVKLDANFRALTYEGQVLLAKDEK